LKNIEEQLEARESNKRNAEINMRERLGLVTRTGEKDPILLRLQQEEEEYQKKLEEQKKLPPEEPIEGPKPWFMDRAEAVRFFSNIRIS
jgi:hypothetical protein